jgi:hypothetical protein
LLVLITELLSLFHLLNFAGVLAAWLAVCGITIYLLWRERRVRGLIRLDTSGFVISLRYPLILSIVGIIAVIGLNALIAPPNSWDALAYHLPRVVHWIQDQSVAHFATHYPHQVYQNPGSEFFIVHFQILSGGDRFANMVQWLCMIGSIVVASLLAQRLGGGAHAQLLAALLVATLPIGISQASGSYTDYTPSFWVACFAFYVILMSGGQVQVSSVLWAGLSLGLAILTKATAYLYAFPFLLWLMLMFFRRFRLAAWKQLGVVAIVAFSLNVGHYARNFEVFGSPLGPAESHLHTNEVMGLQPLTSNLIRNLSLQFATPSSRINVAIVSFVRSIHSMFAIDVNDPRTTLFAPMPQWLYGLPTAILDDSSAGNPLHLCLILTTAVVAVANVHIRRRVNLMTYGGMVLVMYLLLCLVLKWQPMGSRFQLAIFVLASPFVAVVFSKTFLARLSSLIAVVLLVLALPFLLHNNLRPLVAVPNVVRASTTGEESKPTIFETTRESLYFRQVPYMQERYLKIVEHINAQRCTEVGLLLDEGVLEYPLWIMLQEKPGHNVRIEHVNVRNPTRAKADPSFVPCVVVFVGDTYNSDGAAGKLIHNDIVEVNGQEYVKDLDVTSEQVSSLPLSVFRR